MAESRLPFAEGASINRPPMFSGENYQFWKIRMKIFIQSVDHGVWDAIVNGPYVPRVVVDGQSVSKPWSEWDANDSKLAQYDCIAKNIITSALNMDEFFRVSQCNSAKEMWDTLEVTHEGTSDVKRARKHALIQEYELFRMKQGESIADVQKRFTHIVNHLIGLGKEFDKEELNIKILKCLDRSWQPKVTAISETKDLTTLTTAALFGKLREHELEMNRLNEIESGDRKMKSVALKTSAPREDISEEASSSCSEAETLNLLTRKFSKFLKKKKNQKGKRYTSKPDHSSNFTCFGCGKQGHIKVDCPNQHQKDKGQEKKFVKKKQKRAYIAWDDNDTSSSSSSSEEEANLCLMAGDSTSSSVSSTPSFTHENYYDLLNAFKETHEEANRLAQANNRYKGLNNWLEKRVSDLEEENRVLKEDFENLEMIYENSSSDICEKQVKNQICETCEVLKNKVNDLMKTIVRLTCGINDLNAQRVFEKESLTFEKKFKKKNKVRKGFHNYKKGSSSSTNVTCFYCLVKGHTVRHCRVRLHDYPSGFVKWVPKGTPNHLGPEIDRGPNLAI